MGYTPTCETVSEEEHYDNVPGSRLSITEIETLLDYQINPNKEERKSKSELLEDANLSIYGTQIHNLQYFGQIFQRVNQLGRTPNEQDFLSTFVTKPNEYGKALGIISNNILKYTDTNLKPEEKAINFWNEWRINGQNFEAGNKSGYIIPPIEIKQLWENNQITYRNLQKLKDTLIQSSKADKLDITKYLILNEVGQILNISFPSNRLQLISAVDEICIPKDYPNKPIRIIDYKTGKQLKNIGYNEKIQLFLMGISTYFTINDLAYTSKFNLSQWDTVHEKKDLRLPHLGKKHIFQKNIVKKIGYWDILEQVRNIRKSIVFSYINPINGEERNIYPNDVFLGNIDEIRETLGYIELLNREYIESKNIIKEKIRPKIAPYSLPKFEPNNFLKTEKNKSFKGIQIAFDMF